MQNTESMQEVRNKIFVMWSSKIWVGALNYWLSKFQDKKPNFINCIIFIKSKRDSEYVIAQRRGKLSAHFKKWRFDL